MERRLLAIEEDPFDRDVMSKIFSDRYEIKFIANVKDANGTCSGFHPDVILFDMRIPDIEALRMLTRTKPWCDHTIPLVVLASENPIEIERFAREHGVFYYMMRPFDFKELAEVLNAAFCHAAKLRVERNRVLCKKGSRTL